MAGAESEGPRLESVDVWAGAPCVLSAAAGEGPCAAAIIAGGTAAANASNRMNRARLGIRGPWLWLSSGHQSVQRHTAWPKRETSPGLTEARGRSAGERQAQATGLGPRPGSGGRECGFRLVAPMSDLRSCKMADAFVTGTEYTAAFRLSRVVCSRCLLCLSCNEFNMVSCTHAVNYVH